MRDDNSNERKSRDWDRTNHEGKVENRDIRFQTPMPAPRKKEDGSDRE